MRENLAIQHYGHSKVEAHNRGSSPIAGRHEVTQLQLADPIVPFPSDLFGPLHGTIAATLAMHEACAQHWGKVNQYCSSAFWIVRPFYLFPFELMQQYFSFILGYRVCVSEPVATQHRTQRDLPLRPSGRLDLGPRLEEMGSVEQAMDVATGASTEMWFEIVHEGAEVEKEEEEMAAAMAA